MKLSEAVDYFLLEQQPQINEVSILSYFRKYAMNDTEFVLKNVKAKVTSSSYTPWRRIGES